MKNDEIYFTIKLPWKLREHDLAFGGVETPPRWPGAWGREVIDRTLAATHFVPLVQQ